MLSVSSCHLQPGVKAQRTRSPALTLQSSPVKKLARLILIPSSRSGRRSSSSHFQHQSMMMELSATTQSLVKRSMLQSTTSHVKMKSRGQLKRKTKSLQKCCTSSRNQAMRILLQRLVLKRCVVTFLHLLRESLSSWMKLSRTKTSPGTQICSGMQTVKVLATKLTCNGTNAKFPILND